MRFFLVSAGSAATEGQPSRQPLVEPCALKLGQDLTLQLLLMQGDWS